MLIAPSLAILSIAFLAEAFDFSPLANVGGIGLVLAWMLWKAEPRMRGIESAIDRNTKSILILMLEIERTTPQAKAQARQVLEQIHMAESARGDQRTGATDGGAAQ